MLSISNFNVPRIILPTYITVKHHVDVHAFSTHLNMQYPQSRIYEPSTNEEQRILGFLMGKSKLASLQGHKMPRLYLIGAVLATEVGKSISNHLNIPPDRFHCYTDSRIFKLYPEISHACNRSRGKDSSDFPHQLSGFMYQPVEIEAMLRLDLLTKPQPSGILCIGGRPRNLWVRRFYPFTWSTSHCKLIVINFHKRTVVYLYFSSS